MIDVATQVEVLRLHYAEHLSFRKIAKQLSIHRRTVRNIIKQGRVRTERKGRASHSPLLDPYKTQIARLLDDAPERSAVNILQRLREAGYVGGMTILRDYLRDIRPKPAAEAFMPLSFAPAEAAQVDWGDFGDVFQMGCRVSAFAMVLCHSRMLYLEFTLRQTLPTLLRCYERALHFFGGVCREIWHDNMPTVAVERCGRLRRFTERFLAYSGFRHFEPVLCNVGKGNEKGRVEDAIKLIRYQFWPGRSFRDLADLNAQACTWRDRYANRREHHATRKIPELVFAQEKRLLLPLAPVPYDTDDLVTTLVSPLCRVAFDGNRYSVPSTMVGKTVTVRGDDTLVRVSYRRRHIAAHRRAFAKCDPIDNPAHFARLKEQKGIDKDPHHLQAARAIGPHTQRYLELIQAGKRSLRAEIDELLCLATVFGPDAVEQTIAQMLIQGIVGAAHLERLLQQQQSAPCAPPPLSLAQDRLKVHVPRPQLESYDALLLDARHPIADEQEKPQ
jgi:transposase